MGHDVYILQEIELPPNPNPNGPHYISMRDFVQIDSFDAVIDIRGMLELFRDWKAKKNFLWYSDSYRTMGTYGLGDKRIIERADGLFLVSQWHVDSLCEASGFPKDKTCIVPNGIHLEHFAGSEERHPKRLIYTAAPDRGLVNMPIIYGALKMRHLDLELHVFSSVDRYFSGWTPGNRYYAEDIRLYDILSSMPGVTFHGSVLQSQLARELMKSSLFIYPCNFEETSCITAMEAMAAGCAIITSDLGALKETIQEAGVFIDGKPGSDEYTLKFIEEADNLLNDPQRIQELASCGLKQAKELTWENAAARMVNYLINFHHL